MLANAVARHETASCTKGYGAEYRNCFGIKNGNTAPCPKIGRNKMCIYENKEDSYQAFYKIWKKWYKKFPNYVLADRYANDRSGIWLANVTQFYNEQNLIALNK